MDKPEIEKNHQKNLIPSQDADQLVNFSCDTYSLDFGQNSRPNLMATNLD